VAVPKVTLPKPGERRERVLERSEVAAMLWACRRLSREEHVMGNMGKLKFDYSHVARFILIGLYTGTRHDRIVRLGWDETQHGGHVDLERGVIFRRGSREHETSKRSPPVAISRRLHAHLVRWKERHNPGVSFVIHHKGHRILKMKKAWATVRKAAGLGPEVTPHVLRHTCASWHLWDGKTIWEVAGIIGADASTVERTYGHHKIDGKVRGFER